MIHQDMVGQSRKAASGGTVLLIEDDAQIARLVVAELRDAGFSISHAPDGASGIRKHRSGGIDLVLLDLNLPDLDGLEVCDQVRNADPSIPILMLTARAEKTHVVQGLERGADDYLIKPFDSLELIARIRALLRRAEIRNDRNNVAPSAERIERGALSIDLTNRITRIGDRVIELTAKEFELLLLFARHPSRPFSRDELLRRIWGDGFEGYEHTVNTHINRLRNKIETEPRRPTMIETVWGTGYRFTTPTEKTA